MVWSRTVRILGHLFVGLAMAVAVAVEGNRRLSRERLGGWWHRRLLRILDIRLTLHGVPVEGPRILVCNHISWLDIPILGACQPTRFVSKAEVEQWPIAGWLANAAGTFYLKRGGGGTRALIEALRQQVRHGPVTFFPEGTTTEGDTLLRFQPRLFAAAIEAECVIQPVALRYGRAANGENIAAFVGEMTLTAHLRRLMREPSLTAELIYCPPINAQGYDRNALAQATQAAIAAALRVTPAPASKLAA